VIVGGMLLSPFCSLIVIPTFARLFMPRPRHQGKSASYGATETIASTRTAT